MSKHIHVVVVYLNNVVGNSTHLIEGVRRMIDPDGYRPNVGIVLMHADGRLFWARRIARDGWQFPQGGMRTDETPIEAMYRELEEETGLATDDVEVLGATAGWLRYRLPHRYLRRREKPVCVGQKQVWFLLRMVGAEDRVRLDACDHPEFDSWRWVDFWYPVDNVVAFKREVYLRALRQLMPKAEHATALCLTEPCWSAPMTSLQITPLAVAV